MAAETVIESFCERCGTRYTFEPVRKRESKLVGLGKQLGILLEDHAAGLTQRDPFHGTFHFCLECRQYTCPRCWNESAGFCVGCIPLPDMPDTAALDAAEAEAGLEAAFLREQAVAEHDQLAAPEAWPDADLHRRRAEAAWPLAETMAVAAATDQIRDVDAPEPETTPDPEPEAPTWTLAFDAEPATDLTEVPAADWDELEADAALDMAELDVAAVAETVAETPEADMVWFDEAADVAADLAAATTVLALGAPEAAVDAPPAAEPADVPEADGLEADALVTALVGAAIVDGIEDQDDQPVVDAVVSQPEDEPAAMDAASVDPAEAAEAAESEPLMWYAAELAPEQSNADGEAGTAADAETVAEPDLVLEQPTADAEPELAAEAMALAEPDMDHAMALMAVVDDPTELAVPSEPEVASENPAPLAAAAEAGDDDADWADLLRHLPAALDDDASTDDWSAMAPALGPDIAAADEPAAPVAPTTPMQPVPAPAPAVAWQLTPPLPEGEPRPTAWPPLGPVFRPAPPAPPAAPHPSVLTPRAANGGLLSRGQSAGATPAAMPNGVRPCVSCELPLSASARFCRRCGHRQG